MNKQLNSTSNLNMDKHIHSGWAGDHTHISRPLTQPFTDKSRDVKVYKLEGLAIMKPKPKPAVILTPFNEQDVIALRLYEELRQLTDDHDLLKYWAFDVEYFWNIQNDEYQHGLYKSKIHAHRNQANELVLSTPHIKFVISGCCLTILLPDNNNITSKTITKGVIPILMFIRSTIEKQILETKIGKNMTVQRLHDLINESHDAIQIQTRDHTFTFATEPNVVIVTVSHPDKEDVIINSSTNNALIKLADELSDATRMTTDIEGLMVMTSLVTIHNSLNDRLINTPDFKTNKDYQKFVDNIGKKTLPDRLQSDKLITTLTYDCNMLSVKILIPNQFCNTKHFGMATTVDVVIKFIDDTYQKLELQDRPNKEDIKNALLNSVAA